MRLAAGSRPPGQRTSESNQPRDAPQESYRNTLAAGSKPPGERTAETYNPVTWRWTGAEGEFYAEKESTRRTTAWCGYSYSDAHTTLGRLPVCAMKGASAKAPPAGTPGDKPAPIQLHCADALSAPLGPAERMSRAKAVLEASQRMPAVAFFGGAYGERWYVDMIALPHNAVRRQLYDAFLIANALTKMVYDVAEADLARVYAWLGSLDRFVTAIFDAEERFLYPLVDSALRRIGMPCPARLVMVQRTKTKHEILDLLSATRKTRDVASTEVRARIYALRYAMDQFGERILEYLHFTEGFIPKLFKSGLKNGEKEKLRTERAMFDFLLAQPHGGLLGALLLQCIDDRARRADFVTRNIKRKREREAFDDHIRVVETRHMHLAAAFENTATQYERVYSVHTFMSLCSTDVSKEETLRMIGDVDLAEG